LDLCIILAVKIVGLTGHTFLSRHLVVPTEVVKLLTNTCCQCAIIDNFSETAIGGMVALLVGRRTCDS